MVSVTNAKLAGWWISAGKSLTSAFVTCAVVGCAQSVGPIDAAPDAEVASDAGLDTTPTSDACTRDAASLPHLRRLLPPSMTYATSQRPTFRWILTPPATGAILEICSDPMCASVASQYTVTGDRFDLPTRLQPGVVAWRLRPTADGCVGAPNWPLKFVVPRNDAQVSSFWGVFPDIDGDGIADVGSVEHGTLLAYVLHGHRGGVVTGGYQEAMTQANGGAYTLVAVGDTGGDGSGDLCVVDSDGSSLALIVGFPADSRELEPIPLRIPPGARGNATVAAVGDVNLDGFADIVVSFGANNGMVPIVPPTSVVALYYGRNTGLFNEDPTLIPTPTGWVDPDRFGWSVAGIGDINGDGYADFAIGNQVGSNDGIPHSIAVYFGSASGPPSQPSMVISAPPMTYPGFFSARIAGVGDLNGDGYPELMELHTDSHTGYLYFGGRNGPSSSPVTFATPGFSTQFSFWGSPILPGDVNGDGLSDLVVVTRGALAVQFGHATGFSSTPDNLIPIDNMQGPTSARSSVGDLNADGFDDLVVGINGELWIYYGSPQGLPLQPSARLQSPSGMLVGFGTAVF